MSQLSQLSPYSINSLYAPFILRIRLQGVYTGTTGTRLENKILKTGTYWDIPGPKRRINWDLSVFPVDSATRAIFSYWDLDR